MNCFHFPDFASVHADNCGCAILSPGWTHPRRQLDSSVLIIGVRGRVPIMNGKDGHETEYVIESGTVVILPAGNIHYGSCAITEPAMYYWFHFTLAGAPNIVPQTDVDAMLDDDTFSSRNLAGTAILPLNFRLGDAAPFYQYFRELLFEQENPSYTKQKFQILFQILVIRLTETMIAERHPEHSGINKSSIAYSIVTWMSEHLTDPNLSTKIIAAAIGLNPDYAGRRFRHVMGLSIGDYMLKKRLELGKRQIEGNERYGSEDSAGLRVRFNPSFLAPIQGSRGSDPD